MDGNNNPEANPIPIANTEADSKPADALNQSFTESTEGRIMNPSLVGKDLNQVPVEHSQARPDNPSRRGFLKKMLMGAGAIVGLGAAGAGAKVAGEAVLNSAEQVMEQNRQIDEKGEKDAKKWETDHPKLK